MSAPTEVPYGWVIVEKLHRLWSAVPDEERVTPEQIQSKPFTLDTMQKDLDRLTNPRCPIAVRTAHYANRWMPCNGPVAEGAERCANHGGPRTTTASAKSGEMDRLRAENEHLRAKLAAAGVDG